MKACTQMSTTTTPKDQPKSRLKHRSIEFYVTPHRVLRALRATEVSTGSFRLAGGGTTITARRGSQLWEDDRAGVLGRGSIALVQHLLDCSENDATEWLANFALMRWRWMDSSEFERRAA